MPIYEFACPKCRRIFSFLSKRVNPGPPARLPQVRQQENCPSRSAGSPWRKGLKEPAAKMESETGEPPMPDLDDPRMARAMAEMERDMEHLDENNPEAHGAHDEENEGPHAAGHDAQGTGHCHQTP